MTGLRRLVIVTIAVVLAMALVAYLLRPTATPTTASTANQPPPDQTCSGRIRANIASGCGTPAAPGGGGTSGSGKDSKGDRDSDDHDSDDHSGHKHGGHDGDEGKDPNDRGHDGQQGGHSDRGHGTGTTEPSNP